MIVRHMIENAQFIIVRPVKIAFLFGVSLLNFIFNLINALGVFNCILLIVFFIAFAIWISNKSTSSRRQYLLDKYGNTDVVERVMNGSVWIGQTAEQLRDARGAPVDVDETVTKAMISQVWKYQRRGQNRYALRVFLDNDVVVGWKTSNE